MSVARKFFRPWDFTDGNGRGSTNEHRDSSDGTPRRAALRNAPAIGSALRGNDRAGIYAGSKRSWDIFLRRNRAPGRSGRGADFHDAIRNHFDGKHADSVSWTGIARLRLSDRSLE